MLSLFINSKGVNMTKRQLQVLQTITNDSWLQWKTGHSYEGSMTFSITPIGDQILMHASNTDSTEWFQKQVIIQAMIGPKGGINQFKEIR